MMNIDYQGSYFLLKFEDIRDFDGNPNDIFDQICMIDYFLVSYQKLFSLVHHISVQEMLQIGRNNYMNHRFDKDKIKSKNGLI